MVRHQGSPISEEAFLLGRQCEQGKKRRLVQADRNVQIAVSLRGSCTLKTSRLRMKLRLQRLCEASDRPWST